MLNIVPLTLSYLRAFKYSESATKKLVIDPGISVLPSEAIGFMKNWTNYGFSVDSDCFGKNCTDQTIHRQCYK